MSKVTALIGRFCFLEIIYCFLEIIYCPIFLPKILTDWLIKSSEADINNGKGQAYCKLCKVNLRAHKADLNKHKGTNMHIAREKLLPKNL